MSGGWQSQLHEDVGVVFLDRADGQDELLGDARVGAALGHQLEHLALARRQPVERVVRLPFREEEGYDLRVERSSPFCNTPDGLDEVGDVEDAVLEEIANAAAGVREQLGCVGELDVLLAHCGAAALEENDVAPDAVVHSETLADAHDAEADALVQA